MVARLDSVYITYWSLLDPLCQSQSLPYLRALANEGYRIGFITFEQPRWRMTRAQRRAKREELISEGIYWHPLRYHKRPRVVSTVFDIGVGGLFAAALAKFSRARFVHGRSSVSCAAAALASGLAGTRLFADADGPLSQEYVDAGVWKEGSIGHRLTAWGERKTVELSDVVAVLTKHRQAEVSALLDGTPVHVIPCAVDLDRFRPLPAQREQLRRDLGLEGTVFVYVGKAGGWYDAEAMIAFVEAAKTVFEPLTLIVLTRDDEARFAELCARRNVNLVIRAAEPPEVPGYLSAADVGLSFRRRLPSQLSCSPIKCAEYLACGLPIVSTNGCGDYDELIERERVGVLVRNDGAEQYQQAALRLRRLLAEKDLGERCVSSARRFLGLRETVVPRYSEIYKWLSSGVH